MTDCVNDLLYCPLAAAEAVIRARWPDAVLEEVWDDIHEDRTSVYVEVDRKSWFSFLAENGLSRVSLWFQLDRAVVKA